MVYEVDYFTFGGSVVIFMLDWSIDRGKSGCGLELNQSLNLGLILLVCNVSTILSNLGIQLSDRWQFAKNTQSPSLAPFCNSL